MSIGTLYVDALNDELRAKYPGLPTGVKVFDEPTGDFGIAHFMRIDPDGSAVLSFDDRIDVDGVLDVEPSRKTAAHELGHGLHAKCGGNPRTYSASDPVLRGFVAAMDYPFTLEQIIAEGQRRGDWKWFIGEHFAEAFAYIVMGFRTDSRGGIWANHGGRFNDRRPQLDAFFRALRPVTKEIDMDLTELRRIIREEIAADNLRDAGLIDVRLTLEGTDGGATVENGGIKGFINKLRNDYDKHTHCTEIPRPGVQ